MSDAMMKWLTLLVAAFAVSIQIPALALDQSTGMSRLERAYTARVTNPVRLFGYDAFDARGPARPAIVGEAPGNYLISVGDRLTIAFRGRIEQTESVVVSPSGSIIVDHLPPLLAAGKTLSAFRNHIRAHARDRLLDTDVYVSLARAERLSLFIAGEVVRPGWVILPPFPTVIDALQAAGGVKHTGSLRQLFLERSGRRSTIDLYPLLLGRGGEPLPRLRPGDTLLVPVIGPTIAVTGDVQRPGIFELPQGQSSMSVEGATKLAGGPLLPGGVTLTLHQRQPNGSDQGRDVTSKPGIHMSEGDILTLSAAAFSSTHLVRISGPVRQPGPRPLDVVPTLSAVVDGGNNLLETTYAHFALLSRSTPSSAGYPISVFSPDSVAKGRFDAILETGDRVIFFDQNTFISDPSDRHVTDIDTQPFPTATSRVTAPMDDHRLRLAINTLAATHATRVDGAVLWPGDYPIAHSLPLGELLTVAGGLSPRADPSTIELGAATDGDDTRRRSIDLASAGAAGTLIVPGQSVRVSAIRQARHRRALHVTGQVTHPGWYDLKDGDRLSSLIDRAGGLTPYAYSDGAIFTRSSAAEAQRNAFRQMADALDQGLAQALLSANGVSTESVAFAREIISDLRARDPAGRIIVEADPGVLASRPETDILLEPGDRIHFPRRPLSVTVAGEVLAPASLRFTSGQTAWDYVQAAGGTTRYADVDRAFVTYPDGTSAPLEASPWRHRSLVIPPGSTIVVPPDPEPLRGIKISESLAKILGQLALTAASIAVIAQ